MNADELERRLEPLLGVESEPQLARDPVNEPMIRHWCDAVDDRNPIYTDPEFAAASPHRGIVAPPTMLQAWTMRGLRPPGGDPRGGGPMSGVLGLLDEAGYTSVVATNCRQEYRRYLRPGDLLTVTTAIEKVSDEKKTGLGTGRFVDQVMAYRDQDGVEVAKMTFRLLKFRPPQREKARPPRPRPARSPDNAFFWEGVERGELLIQRCAGCGELRHPPGPMCPHCHSLEWNTLKACGRGSVYSFVVSHHPPLPAFDQPNGIVLVELEEGTRLVSNLVGVATEDIVIGMPVEVVFTQVDPEMVLPLFQPVTDSR